MSARHVFQDEWFVRAARTIPAVAARLEEFRAARQPSLFEAALKSGAADSDALLEAIRASHRVKPLASDATPDRPAIALVNEKICRRYGLVPIRLRDDTIEIAMENPLDLEAQADLQALTGRRPVPLFATHARVGNLLAHAYSPELIVHDMVGRLEENAVVEVVDENEAALAAHDVRAPIVRLIGSLIAKAYHMRASDIHLEHDERSSVVRFRVDGELKNIMTLPLYVGAGPAVSRLKIMAKLDIADRLRPQDGRAKLRIGGVEIGLRVSTLPTNFGEKVVIRLLDKRTAEVPFEKLGFRPELAQRLSVLLRSAQGLVLVTGPTGAGKTTTLYSVLNKLKAEATNIVTIEDPVEYKLDGINQVQVAEKQGLTFATVLRSVLRQDPDVILVGEIRDRETAETAIQAAMTGHLVISTLHTNDALSTVLRLADMGVERFNLAPALIAITAQRLVRSLCPACRVPVSPPDAALAAAQRTRGMVPAQFAAKGCSACDFHGYKGRIGLIELLEMTPGLRLRIVEGDGEAALREFALAEKSLSTLLEDALWRVGLGDTSLEEVAPYVQFDARRPGPEAVEAIPSFPPVRPAPPAPASADAEAAAAGAGGRVLIADDDPTIRIILRKVLEGLGYRVETTENGAQALASIAAEEPAMLLADLNMPDLDGYGLLRGVRQSLGLMSLPIIVLTADADDRSQSLAFELGADDYIVKPIKVPIVAARVKAAFRRAAKA